MPDDKKDGIFEDVCEGVGTVGGIVVGGVAGIVRGAVGVATSGGDWSQFGKKFDDTVNSCEKEGGRIGRRYMPATTLGVLGAAVLLLTGKPPRR